MIKVRINWCKYKKFPIVRGHRILEKQPVFCRFDQMNEKNYTDHSSITEAETAIKEHEYNIYKRCKYCWDNKRINL